MNIIKYLKHYHIDKQLLKNGHIAQQAGSILCRRCNNRLLRH
ncbi:hypothetical protein [Rickettsia felis]|nr:hypothetical protein [Rickettsia felis]